MNNLKSVNVFYNGRSVGTIAIYERYLCAFEYSREWLADGFSISPLSLPLEQKVFISKREPFDGLFGVFADSLPDGWGQLLLDRMLRKNKINVYGINSLHRLSFIGNTGMGALEYKPETYFGKDKEIDNFDEIAEQCKKILSDQPIDKLEELYTLGGSSGGARPKILCNLDNEEWIVKFASSTDKENIGIQEFEYSLCARKCGIEMMETELLHSSNCSGYFATKRFDRIKGKKIHMISVAGILETSHRYPNLDYNDLMRLTLMITNDYRQLEQLFRRMCFNVFAHNRDDHSKNFSYLYDEDKGGYVLSPAYDLTYSNSIGGEHATTIDGNGLNPSEKDILAVADNIGINITGAKEIMNEIKKCVEKDLIKK